MKVETVAIASLTLDPVNARRHDAKNLEAIKGSLAKFGAQKPIVVGKNNVVIAGNGTLEAARALGWEKIDVVRTALTGAEATAFALADNRSSELAAWDDEVLRSTLKALGELDFDLGALGFDAIAAKEDEWGDPPDDPPADAPGAANRIILIYPPDEYRLVFAMAEQALDDLGIAEMSSLFRKLLEDRAICNGGGYIANDQP